jgi:inner membrane protein
MQNKLFHKLLTIAVISSVLLIPLALIKGTISERQGRQDAVNANIAEAAAGEQKLVGPFVAVFYKEQVEKRNRDAATGRETVGQETVEKSMLLPLGHLDIKGDVRVEARYRGIYSARLYHTGLQVAGDFALAPHLGLPAERRIFSPKVFVLMGISDLRGVDNDPIFTSDGMPRQFKAGGKGILHGQGMHAELGEVDLSKGARYEFSFPLHLTGSERLAIAPAGDETAISLIDISVNHDNR